MIDLKTLKHDKIYSSVYILVLENYRDKTFLKVGSTSQILRNRMMQYKYPSSMDYCPIAKRQIVGKKNLPVPFSENQLFLRYFKLFTSEKKCREYEKCVLYSINEYATRYNHHVPNGQKNKVEWYYYTDKTTNSTTAQQ